MRNALRHALYGIRLLLPIVMALAFAGQLAAQPAEPSAAGLWQKTEKGKPVGWFLVVERNGLFEGAFARLFPEPIRCARNAPTIERTCRGSAWLSSAT